MASLSFLGVLHLAASEEDQGKRLQLLITSTGKDSMTLALKAMASPFEIVAFSDNGRYDGDRRSTHADSHLGSARVLQQAR